MNKIKDHGFKKKTIASIIDRKIRHWVKTIDNEQLRQNVLNDYIVTGGAIVSMLHGELPNDFDVYFQTPEIALAVAQYYLSHAGVSNNAKAKKIEAQIEDSRVKIYIKSAGIIQGDASSLNDYDYFERRESGAAEAFLNNQNLNKKTKPYSPMMITDNAITLSDSIQIITRFVGNPEEIHKNFDFVHTTNYYTVKTGLVLKQDALEAIIAKELKYVGSLYPLCSMFRLKKFIKRGWSVSAGEMLKIGFDISNLNLHDIATLREQVTGVDAAYFHQLISILEQNKNESETFDRTYLVEMINKVFDSMDPDDESIEEMIKLGE